MTETEKFKALVLIDYWQGKFLVAFPKKPEPKVPLRIGIGKERDILCVISVAVGATQQDIDNALYLWCRGKRYWQSFNTNQYRFNVLGNQSGLITEADRVYAKFKLRTCIHKDGDKNDE